jgi:hypothetical protein
MGKTYGRQNYWIWCSGILKKVVMQPGGIVRENKFYVIFTFKNQSPSGFFCVKRKALATTRKIAEEMDISTREYLWERL